MMATVYDVLNASRHVMWSRRRPMSKPDSREVKGWIDAGLVTVDGEPVTVDTPFQNGKIVRIGRSRCPSA